MSDVSASAYIAHQAPALLMLDEQAVHDLKEIGRRHDDQVRHLRMDRFRGLTQLHSMKKWRLFDLIVGVILGGVSVWAFNQAYLGTFFDSARLAPENDRPAWTIKFSPEVLTGIALTALAMLIVLAARMLAQLDGADERRLRKHLQQRRSSARRGIDLDADDTDGPAPSGQVGIASLLYRVAAASAARAASERDRHASV